MSERYLCLVTERLAVAPGHFMEVIEEACTGGVNMLQLREKEAPPPYGRGLSNRELYELACSLRAFCAARKVSFIVNDRLDLAMACDADGVHLGQTDLPVQVARKLWRPDRQYGVSASSVAEALQAERDGADLIGMGAVFYTATKPEAGDTGIQALASVVDAVQLPVVGIGGINSANASQVMATGCAGLAVVSCVWKAPSPRDEAAALAKAVFA